MSETYNCGAPDPEHCDCAPTPPAERGSEERIARIRARLDASTVQPWTRVRLNHSDLPHVHEPVLLLQDEHTRQILEYLNRGAKRLDRNS